MKVLYVEDNPINVRVLRRLLPGVDVTACSTAGAALEAVEREQPQVVLLDYLLPDGNGVVLGRALRRKYPALRLYLVTALGTVDLQILDTSAFDAVLRKPLSLEGLGQVISGKT